MAFGFKKEKTSISPLSEQDIRNRLYGSAVAVTSHVEEKTHKRSRPTENKSVSVNKEYNQERFNINKELTQLRLELAQAKRKLDRIHGVNTKKIRLLIIGCVALFIFISITTLIFKKITSFKPRSSVVSSVSSVVPSGSYAIQVAVLESVKDAESFNSDMLLKGYKSFIYKSRFGSGKEKFIIYIGNFKDKKDASKLLDRLKTKEGIEDSFVSNMPK
ncbi:MAG: SPOR domain-containing protein [Candidatus Saelkia tenebricola]|nr:SPOR domain-containing protein [Candidatus Saelkia tenebricola]